MKWVTIRVTIYDEGGAWVKTEGLDATATDGTYLGGPGAHERAIALAKRRSAEWAAQGRHVPVEIGRARRPTTV